MLHADVTKTKTNTHTVLRYRLLHASRARSPGVGRTFLLY